MPFRTRLFIVLLFSAFVINAKAQSITSFQVDTSGKMSFSISYSGEQVSCTIRMMYNNAWEKIGTTGLVHIFPSAGSFVYTDSAHVPLIPGTNRFRLEVQGGGSQEATVQSTGYKSFENYSDVPHLLFKENVNYHVLDPAGNTVLVDGGKILKFDYVPKGCYYLQLQEGRRIRIIAFTR